MPVVDLAATQPHYLEHTAPVWRALRPDERGALIIPDRLRPLAASLDVHAGSSPRGDVILGAGWTDVKNAHGYRKRVLMEHGVGQSYGGNAAYAGGVGRQAVDLFLCPNKRVADLNASSGDVVVVGSPYLDELRAIERAPETGLVVVSHHWDCHVVPETMSTRRYYADAVTGLSCNRTVRHAHPRDADEEERRARVSGRPFIRDFRTVVRYASAFVCDNSSAMFYAAMLGVPVVVLNAPWYRRDVEHGLRFWEHANIGPNVWAPEELESAVRDALRDPSSHSDAVRRMSDDLAPAAVSGAAERAAQTLRMV